MTSAAWSRLRLSGCTSFSKAKVCSREQARSEYCSSVVTTKFFAIGFKSRFASSRSARAYPRAPAAARETAFTTPIIPAGIRAFSWASFMKNAT